MLGSKLAVINAYSLPIFSALLLAHVQSNHSLEMSQNIQKQRAAIYEKEERHTVEVFQTHFFLNDFPATHKNYLLLYILE